MPVWLFVDWNSQIYKVRRRGYYPSGLDVLKYVVRRITSALNKYSADNFFEIRIRVYSGWHKGFEPTAKRKELSGISETELFDLSGYPNMVVRQLAFGDVAAAALSKRVHRGTNSHYPATCKDRGYQGLEEKMVDTALVSDLIFHSTQPDDSWLIVLGEDVDLVPGIYTAEYFISNTSRRIAYLWSETDKFLAFDGLDQL